MKKNAGIMGTAAGLLKKPALGALKSFGKYELATATGGLAPTAVSLAGSAVKSPTLMNMGQSLTSTPYNLMRSGSKLKGQANQFGQVQDRNNVKVANMNIKKLNRTFDQMTNLEKKASVDWKDIAIGTAISTVVPMAIGAGAYGAKQVGNHIKSERTWKSLVKEDPTLTARDRENFQVLKQFGSGLSHNKTTAKSFLDRTRNTYMMPHEFVGDLVNTQDKIDRNSSISDARAIGSSALGMGMNYAKNKSDAGGRSKQASLKDVISEFKEEINAY